MHTCAPLSNALNANFQASGAKRYGLADTAINFPGKVDGCVPNPLICWIEDYFSRVLRSLQFFFLNHSYCLIYIRNVWMLRSELNYYFCVLLRDVKRKERWSRSQKYSFRIQYFLVSQKTKNKQILTKWLNYNISTILHLQENHYDLSLVNLISMNYLFSDLKRWFNVGPALHPGILTVDI